MLTSPKQHPSVFPPCVFLHFRFLAFSPLLFYLDLDRYLWAVQNLLIKVGAVDGERDYTKYC